MMRTPWAWLALLCLSTLSPGALADETDFTLPKLSDPYLSQTPLQLAALDAPSEHAAPAAVQPAFEPPLITPGHLHEWLGVATVAAAAATFLTHTDACKEPGCDTLAPRDTQGTHAQLGRATAALALATVTSGLLVHWDDFHLEDGWKDPDNLHVLLGVTGAALMAYAINKSARSDTTVSHAGMAEAGALGMMLAIKMTW